MTDLPPHDMKTEDAVLGSILNDDDANRALCSISDLIPAPRARWFFRRENKVFAWALDAAAAGRHQVADYLAQGPSPWQPADVDAARWQPDFVVAADGSGTHRSVQAAVDAVPARAADPGAQRTWVIRVRPGTYRGPLCLRGLGPIALVGLGDTPNAVKVRLHRARQALKALLDPHMDPTWASGSGST